MENVINLTEVEPNRAIPGIVDKNAATNKTSPLVPYCSYLSQIYVKQLPMTLQCDPKKSEVTNLQCDQNKKEVPPISFSDSDDELYMWVDEPVVVDLVSSDDEGGSTHSRCHEKKLECQTDLKSLKGEPGNIVVNDQRVGIPVGTTTTAPEVNTAATEGTSDAVSLEKNDTVASPPSIVAEVNTTDTQTISDTVPPELNSVVTSPISVTAVKANTGATGETFDTVPPEENSIAPSPSSVTAVVVNTVAIRETSDYLPPELNSIVTSQPSTLRIYSVESLHPVDSLAKQAFPSPHVVTSPAYSTTSPDYAVDSTNHAVGSILKVDSLDSHVATSGRSIPHTLKRSHDVLESRDIDCPDRHATNRSKTTSSSERYDIGSEDRRKKRKMLAEDRFYAGRDHTKKKDVDHQTFAPSDHRKSNSLTSKKDMKSSQERLRNDTYGSSRHSRFSPGHSRPVSLTIHRETVENEKTREGLGLRDSSVEQKLVSEVVSVNKPENIVDPSRSVSSDNQRSLRPFRDYRWEAILISRENARPLLSTVNGYNFLNDAFENYRVQLRMNWAKHNHVLWVSGSDLVRTRFINALNKFFERSNESQSTVTKSSTSQPTVINKQSTVSKPFASRSTEINGFESLSTVSKGSAKRSTVINGFGSQSTVSKPFSSQPTEINGFEPVSTVSKGSASRSTVINGFGSQSTVSKPSASQSTEINGFESLSTVSKASVSQSTVISGLESQSAVNDSFEKPVKGRAGFGDQLPKRKWKLIYRIEENLSLLNESFGDPESLFDYITKNERKKMQNYIKRANRARKVLNIILLGQAGLRDGSMHLTSLKKYLQTIKNITADAIHEKLVAVIETHFNYIFSSYKHSNYPALIAEYKALGKFPTSLDSQAVAHQPSDKDAQQALLSISTETTNNRKEAGKTPPE